LFYKNYAEFEACTDYLLEHKDAAIKMGENGFRYVTERFTHEAIAKKYVQFLNALLGEADSVSSV
jgi:spore maturation protein CgeB